MRIVIDIPEEFEKHFDADRFEDSLHRLSADAHLIAGRYEQETAIMLINALKNATLLPKGHGRLIDVDVELSAMDTWDKFGYTETGCFVRNPKNDYVPYVHYEDMVKSIRYAPTIIEADNAERGE